MCTALWGGGVSFIFPVCPRSTDEEAGLGGQRPLLGPLHKPSGVVA